VRRDEGRLFQTVETQHENRRVAMFVDEDCVDSRSDVDDLRARDCLYDESRPVRYDVASHALMLVFLYIYPYFCEAEIHTVCHEHFSLKVVWYLLDW